MFVVVVWSGTELGIESFGLALNFILKHVDIFYSKSNDLLFLKILMKNVIILLYLIDYLIELLPVYFRN